MGQAVDVGAVGVDESLSGCRQWASAERAGMGIPFGSLLTRPAGRNKRPCLISVPHCRPMEAAHGEFSCLVISVRSTPVRRGSSSRRPLRLGQRGTR